MLSKFLGSKVQNSQVSSYQLSLPLLSGRTLSIEHEYQFWNHANWNKNDDAYYKARQEE